MNKNIVIVLIFVAVMAGLLAFSMYAHERIENNRNAFLSDKLHQVEIQNTRLRETAVALSRRNENEKQRIYDMLIVMFPGDENRERIHALLYYENEKPDEPGYAPGDEPVKKASVEGDE